MDYTFHVNTYFVFCQINTSRWVLNEGDCLIFIDYSKRNAYSVNHTKWIAICFYSLNMIDIKHAQRISISIFITHTHWVTLVWVNIELKQGVNRDSITATFQTSCPAFSFNLLAIPSDFYAAQPISQRSRSDPSFLPHSLRTNPLAGVMNVVCLCNIFNNK